MLEICDNDKTRLLEFIKENDLDYDYNSDDQIRKFKVIAHDGIHFSFYKNNEDYVIVKYDSKKDNGNPGATVYEYYTFQNLPQVLEQLSFYDKSLSKSYWEFIPNTLEIGFDKTNYNESWCDEFMSDEFWNSEESSSYKSIVYSNPNYKPELKSPYNTIHEVSTINTETFTEIDKLYFEIHPISCSEKRESYLLKLLCNNEETLKEYINYKVYSKKGLKLLVGNIFGSLSAFKIDN
jgi:hypothetical protein